MNTCASGDRCRQYDPRTKTSTNVDHCPLCNRCLEAAEQDLRALLLDYRDLEQWLPPALGVWGDGRAGFAYPAPLRIHIDSLQREIVTVLTAWERAVRHNQALTPPAVGVRAGWAVQAAVTLLAPRLHALANLRRVTLTNYPTPCPQCGHRGVHVDVDNTGQKQATCGSAECGHRWTQPHTVELDGTQGLRDIRALHARARHALALTTAQPEIIIGVVCKNLDCDTAGSLIREPGTDEVICTQCQRRYPPDEYTAWVKHWAASISTGDPV